MNLDGLPEGLSEQRRIPRLKMIEVPRQVLRQQRRHGHEFADSAGKLRASFEHELFATPSQFIGPDGFPRSRATWLDGQSWLLSVRLSGPRPRHEFRSQPRPLSALADDDFEESRLLDIDDREQDQHARPRPRPCPLYTTFPPPYTPLARHLRMRVRQFSTCQLCMEHAHDRWNCG